MNLKIIVGGLAALCLALCTVHSSDWASRIVAVYFVAMAVTAMILAGYHFEKNTRTDEKIDYATLFSTMLLMFWGAEGLLSLVSWAYEEFAQSPIISNQTAQISILTGWMLGFCLHYLHVLRCIHLGQPKTPKI